MHKIAVFSFDAGGSEMIASLQRAKKGKYRFYNFSQRGAPFINIVKDKDIMIESSFDKIAAKLRQIQPDLIITGTSWQTKTDALFLNYGKENNIPTLSFVDHWTPYRSRFGRHLPDYLATFDQKSTLLAQQEGFEHIVWMQNYHFQELQKEFANLDIQENEQILFLSEPTAEVAYRRFGERRYWGFDEMDVYKEVRDFAQQNGMQLLVRLHPSDTKTGYQKIDPYTRFSTATLLEDIAASKVVIGIDTIALYYAYRFGKKTLALMPTKKRSVVVPLPKSNIVASLHKRDIQSIETSSKPLNDNEGMDFDIFAAKVLS